MGIDEKPVSLMRPLNKINRGKQKNKYSIFISIIRLPQIMEILNLIKNFGVKCSPDLPVLRLSESKKGFFGN